MAKGKSRSNDRGKGQREAKSQSQVKSAVLAAGVHGDYRFRFSGFGRGAGDYPFTVNGVGYIELKTDLTAVGHQWSASMPMMGVSGGFSSGEWNLKGNYAVDNTNGTVTITIYFTRMGDAKPVMYDVFQMVPGHTGNDVFWFISLGPKDMNDNPLDESVTGEAVKV